MWRFWWVAFVTLISISLNFALKNELVKQRLKNEEMEEELVRYKLL